MENYQKTQSRKPWIIGITGASGTCYARRLILRLIENIPDIQLEIVISDAGLRVIREEEGIAASIGRLQLSDLLGSHVSVLPTQKITIHSNRNIGATIASGSYQTAGMVILPCSMRSLAAVANGFAENLLQRAADVVLKEKRTLIVCPRETPLSVIHIENMLRLARLDVRIIPPMAEFYTQPKSISELIDSFVMRIADQMGFDLKIAKRWGEREVLNEGQEVEAMNGVR